jgi:hypothetical protein
VDCKNAQPSVLENSVAKDLDAGYESIMASQMVCVEENDEGAEGCGWCWLIFLEWLDKEAEVSQ